MSKSAARPMRFRINYSTVFVLIAFAVAALAAPIFSVKSGSAGFKKDSGPEMNSISGRSGKASRFASALPRLGLPLQETITTYASDCTTPKVTFVLGETVCAKTDNVEDLSGARWVHWLRPDNSIAEGGDGETNITTNPQTFTYAPDTTGVWKVTIAIEGDISETPAVFTVIGNPPIATYDGTTCTTLDDNFTVGETVCAKADSNFTGTRVIHFVDSEGGVIQSNSISPTSPSANYITTTAGNFRVYLSNDEGGLIARSFFTVSDPQNPKVDLSVLKYNKTGEMASGSPVSYEIIVVNKGPDSASTVQLNDAVPNGLTYLSSTQDSGPSFTRDAEDPTTTWSIASLPAGAEARFTFTYTVTAAAGATVSNTAIVTNNTEETHNEDNTSTSFDTVGNGGSAPECSLDCPNNIVTTATGPSGATVTYAAPEAVGNCGTVTTTPASGSTFPIGTTTVTATSSTGGGVCSFTVTVIDSPAPTISCPANLSATANSGQPSAFVPDPNGSQSNVGTPTTTGTNIVTTGSRDDGEALTAAYPLGVTGITWFVTEYDRDPQDPQAVPTGRSASCEQTITVFPNQVLTITCPANQTVASPNGCEPTTVNPGTATSNSQTATILGRRSDNLAYSNTAAFNDPFPIGTTSIEWTASDTDGQSKSCTQTITVTGNDTTPPTLNVPPSITTSTSSCSVLLDEEQFVATAEDDGACGSTVTISRTGMPQVACPVPGNPNRTCDSFVFPTGTTVITYKATDASGNFSTGTQTVTVNENPNQPPTISAPADLTGANAVNTGPNATICGAFIGDATLGSATANDNCPGVVVTRTGVPAGNIFPVGDTTITYRATDRVGNFTEDTQTVTVIDNTVPVVTIAAVTLYTQDFGGSSCGVIVTNLDGTLGTGSATDNCPGTQNPPSRSGVPGGNFFPVGNTILTYSSTDAHGNTGTATQTVTVVDNTPPTITCPTPIVLEPTCPSGAIATFAAAVVNDNCGVQSQSEVSSPTPNLHSGSVFPIGTTTVTRTVTDIHNNTSSCSFTVTVKTALQTLDDLRASVAANTQLSPPQRNGLLSKLDAARQHIVSGNQNGACAKLADFVNSTQNFINNGALSAATGNAWISTANNIRNTIGCTSNPCT